jgi:hypothetical protein
MKPVFNAEHLRNLRNELQKERDAARKLEREIIDAGFKARKITHPACNVPS